MVGVDVLVVVVVSDLPYIVRPQDSTPRLSALVFKPHYKAHCSVCMPGLSYTIKRHSERTRTNPHREY